MKKLESSGLLLTILVVLTLGVTKMSNAQPGTTKLGNISIYDTPDPLWGNVSHFNFSSSNKVIFGEGSFVNFGFGGDPTANNDFFGSTRFQTLRDSVPNFGYVTHFNGYIFSTDLSDIVNLVSEILAEKYENRISAMETKMGIVNSQQKKLEMGIAYPNPFINVVSLDVNLTSKTLLVVFDQNTKCIFGKTFSPGEKIELDGTNWVPGKYFVLINGKTHKIIKE